MRSATKEEINIMHTKCMGPDDMITSLSGGNQQKAIIAREIERDPEILVAVQPTRGLDVGAIENIHNQLINERDKGSKIWW